MDFNYSYTAIKRSGPSRPLRDLIKSYSLPRNTSFYDYGCGYGEDIKYIQSLDYSVEGWDKYIPKEKSIPYLKPETCHKLKQKFNIVLLTYVFCTIPDEKTKNFILYDAWKLVKPHGQLIISTRDKDEIEKQANKSKWKSLKNGYITKWNTYQEGWNYTNLERFAITTIGYNKIDIISYKLNTPYTNIYIKKK